jgi:bifunctional non-homologous end joining protein LigD
VTLSFPSGRTADEIVVDDAAGLAWVVNLGCIDLNPHPVRADDLDHPDELRVDLDPVPGVAWSQIRDVAMVTKEALEAVGLVGWPKTSGSRGIHVNVRIERRWTYPEVRRAALALARDVERRAPAIATSKWWKEERHGVFLDYNQNAKDRTVASAYSVRPLPDARVSTPLTWAELPTCEAEAFTIATVPARFAEIGDPGAGIDGSVGSLEALLELSRRHEAEGLGDAPWPPNYRKQAGEPPRVQPSRQRRATAEYDTAQAEAQRERQRAAMERRFTAELERRRAAREAGDAPPPTRPTPTGRRRTSVPVIEISRAATKDEALAGLERWKVRHPEAAGRLEPADVLVDGMRGRSSLWYRVRVNLTHVPEQDRPPQEALDPDYDPWAGYEWPDRSGQLERSRRRRTSR